MKLVCEYEIKENSLFKSYSILNNYVKSQIECLIL